MSFFNQMGWAEDVIFSLLDRLQVPVARILKTLRKPELTVLSVFLWSILFVSAHPALAFEIDQCAGDRNGKDLGCTANDVYITGIAVAPGSPTSCVGGTTFTVDLDVTVNFQVPERYDIGIFLSNDGRDPQNAPATGGATSCSVSILPLTSPFQNLDSNGGTDTCGDGSDELSGVVRMSAVPVACQAVSLSNGNLFIPFVVTWDNQASPTGGTCTSIADPYANTNSKCNAPDSTVATEVQYGTVNAVILPALTKTDGITTITAGESTTYAVVITNTTGATLNDAIFQDSAVANLAVNSLACSAAGGASCPASYSIAAMQGGGIPLPAMPVGSSITFNIGATVAASTPAGPLVNTAKVTVRGETHTASDTNTVIRKLDVDKSFAPIFINAGETSQLRITLQNSNLTDATNVAFTDNYPANLVNVTPLAITNSCGGTITAATAAPWSLALSGGTIPAGGSCTITADVTSSVDSAYINQTGPVSSDQYAGDSDAAFLAVGVSNLETSTKGWQDLNGGEAKPGDVIRYTITLIETAGVPALGVSISDLVPATLTGLTVTSCPVGATCGFSGQILTATGITIPASGTVNVTFNATIAPGTPAGTEINNCASITTPLGVGATPCAPSLTVSPSDVARSGNKPLYLYDGTSSPAYKLSRTPPTGTPAAATITKATSRLWALSPTLALPVTISPSVTPLAIIPVSLYLASNTANESRTVQVDVNCSAGGPTYTQTKIFDGTAVNYPYLLTTPSLVSFNSITVPADQTCPAGASWNLTVRNNTSGNGTRNVLVYPVSGGNYSNLSLPSLNVINVDSVNSYSAAYPAVTTPPIGYYSASEPVYLRAVVSDPFGSYDITSATITIKDPGGTERVIDAAMTRIVAADTASTKTYEYAYTVPAPQYAGSWTAIVTAREGMEDTVSDSGIGTFSVGMLLPNLTFLKFSQIERDPVNDTSSPKAIPGAEVRYTLQVSNSGAGSADTLSFVDPLPANTKLFVNDLGQGSPVLFADPDADSGFSPPQPFSLAYSDNADCATYDYTPTADADGFDANVCRMRINMSGVMSGAAAPATPDFSLIFRVRIE